MGWVPKNVFRLTLLRVSSGNRETEIHVHFLILHFPGIILWSLSYLNKVYESLGTEIFSDWLCFHISFRGFQETMCRVRGKNLISWDSTHVRPHSYPQHPAWFNFCTIFTVSSNKVGSAFEADNKIRPLPSEHGLIFVSIFYPNYWCYFELFFQMRSSVFSITFFTALASISISKTIFIVIRSSSATIGLCLIPRTPWALTFFNL